MTLRSPLWLLALLPVAALALAYLRVQRRRPAHRAAFAEPPLFARITSGAPGRRGHAAAAGVGIALVVLVVGLARPTHNVLVPRREAVIMLAVDVSGSMAATDVSPSRLAAAIATGQQFVRSLPSGFSVGLVSFGSTATLVASPTRDHATVVRALGNLQIGQATDTGGGLETALAAIRAAQAAGGSGKPPAATIVMLSDGAANVGPSVTQAAQQAAKAGVPVDTIGYGTRNGTVDIQGQLIPVPADPSTMRQIARNSGGTFYSASSAGALSSIYQRIKGEVAYRSTPTSLDAAFLGGAAGILVLGGLASLAWTGRFP